LLNGFSVRGVSIRRVLQVFAQEALAAGFERGGDDRRSDADTLSVSGTAVSRASDAIQA